MTDAGLLALLNEIRDLNREILTELRAQRAPPADSERFAALLKLIDAHCRDFAFTTSELIAHAQLPIAEALRAGIIEAVGALDARKLGHALTKIEGMTLDGLCVRRLARTERDGVVRQVVQVSSSQNTQNVRIEQSDSANSASLSTLK